MTKLATSVPVTSDEGLKQKASVMSSLASNSGSMSTEAKVGNLTLTGISKKVKAKVPRVLHETEELRKLREVTFISGVQRSFMKISGLEGNFCHV